MTNDTDYIIKDRNSLFFPLEERMHDDDPMSSLMTVDLMVTELCNRTCVFLS
jgi:hypothetical protein